MNEPFNAEFNQPHLGSKYNYVFQVIAFAGSFCLSGVVVLLLIGPLTFGRAKAGYSAEKMSALRALFDELPDFAIRAVGVIKIVRRVDLSCPFLLVMFDYWRRFSCRTHC